MVNGTPKPGLEPDLAAPQPSIWVHAAGRPSSPGNLWPARLLFDGSRPRSRLREKARDIRVNTICNRRTDNAVLAGAGRQFCVGPAASKVSSKSPRKPRLPQGGLVSVAANRTPEFPVYLSTGGLRLDVCRTIILQLPETFLSTLVATPRR